MTGPRLRSRRGLRILPSATTVLAICAGLTSIKFALDSRPHIALALIVQDGGLYYYGRTMGFSFAEAGQR
mgnify:CR=1 FL=1